MSASETDRWAWLLVLCFVFGCNVLRILLPTLSSFVSSCRGRRPAERGALRGPCCKLSSFRWLRAFHRSRGCNQLWRVGDPKPHFPAEEQHGPSILIDFQGAAEGCRAGVTDESRDPEHEAGAVHRQHDGVCQIRQAGEKNQQNDRQTQNSREGTDSSVGQDQVVYKCCFLRTTSSVDDLTHLEVLLCPCGCGAQQVDHPTRPAGGLSYSSSRWNRSHLLDFSLQQSRGYHSPPFQLRGGQPQPLPENSVR
uniref:Guided entry of tail-anchored proteins factor 1 n=1 Tax=Rattus norvegicus TaxID=10116 RepID=A0A8I5ZMV3_RAT